MNNMHLVLQFFLQIAVILVCCRVVGLMAARLGQPQAVAEMIAGVLLGPSLFGWLAPEWQQALFPWDPGQTVRDTQSYLFPTAQLGLALYMFTVGMEFRTDILRQNLRCLIAVSAAGVVAPFALGSGIAWFLYRHTQLFPAKTSLTVAMLFLGVSMCVTAFPMLVRIIQSKKLESTTMGTVAIGAAAIGDLFAWSLLAIVLGSFDNNLGHAAMNIGGGLAYVAFVFAVLRPAIVAMQRFIIKDDALTETGFVVGLSLMFLGAWFTDLIGLHTVFGAFVMGAAMPRGIMVRHFTGRIQPLVVALLLPLFFAYSGLNTKIGLLDSTHVWSICLMIIVAAVAGKGVACWLAARWTGMSNREAIGIGVLMNTRGLIELIIINIGLQRGVISDTLFTMLAIMAVLTTFLASPVLDLLYPPRLKPKG